MKPFTQIATPHEDILKGNLTMDVFAANLWQVKKGEAPLDYQDSDLFFKKTYRTKGLENILQVVENRLKGKSGDSIIQLQTPFGGGKTHTLIALYHKAKQWNANVAVFVGTSFSPEDTTPWEELEKQLTGRVEITKGKVSPGEEKLIKIISNHSPVLILIDELLEYATKAAGIKIGDSNLASQTLAFVQELTGAVASAGNSALVLTLPSSVLEHYDENAERMFGQLQKITGRTERIYAPVADDEIEHVIRKRLFSMVDETQAKDIVDKFIDHAKNEGLLLGDEVTSYREKFITSYPFKPEVIDVLYKKWGSFPTFQRTRGILRLLSLVVHGLMDKPIPYIRIGDFDLANDEIKRELIKHIGAEWDSIIAQDIVSKDSGAKKVDNEVGSSYRAYRLGTVVATTIFMNSFSGKGKIDVNSRDIKLEAVYPEFSSTVIDTAISDLREKLFYISDDGLYFTNQPNLNRIILSREENITSKDIEEEEKNLIKRHISNASTLRVYLYPKFPKDIPDSQDLKLIVLRADTPDLEFLEKYGESPRIYKNSLIFLCIDKEHIELFNAFLRKFLALKSLDADKKLKLTESQKKEVKNKLKIQFQREYEELRRLYRIVFLPAKHGLKKLDLGIPTYGETLVDKEIYDRLRTEGEILEKIASKVIKEKYIQDKEYVEARVLYDAFFRTPGEIRLVSKNVFVQGIKQGTEEKLFGYGYLEDGEVVCKYIGEEPDVNLAEGEIIISGDVCEKQIQKQIQREQEQKTAVFFPKEIESSINRGEQVIKDTIATSYHEQKITKIKLKLNVLVGQLSTVAGIARALTTQFDNCSIEITLTATDGKLKQSDYEDKIMEALRQAGIEIMEEEKE